MVEGNEGIGPLAGDSIAAMYGHGPCGDRIFRLPIATRTADGSGCRSSAPRGSIEVLTGHCRRSIICRIPAGRPDDRASIGFRSVPRGPANQSPQGRRSARGNLLACRDLIAAIEQDRLPECNIYEARMTIEMISAVFESHVAGGPVAIPLKNRTNPLARLAD